MMIKESNKSKRNKTIGEVAKLRARRIVRLRQVKSLMLDQIETNHEGRKWRKNKIKRRIKLKI